MMNLEKTSIYYKQIRIINFKFDFVFTTELKMLGVFLEIVFVQNIFVLEN